MRRKPQNMNISEYEVIRTQHEQRANKQKFN